jgi:GNAT superfamily N-acetyltransferase
MSIAAAHPLTAARFADLAAVFGAKGCSFARGCWCMAYRESGRPAVPPGMSLPEWRRAAMQALADRTPSPGLIGYDSGGRPVGWVSLGPREEFLRLRRSPVMKPVDDLPVWSVVCFVVPAPHRGRGVAASLLGHGIAHARAQGAQVLEAYPYDQPARTNDQFLWHGVKTMFDRAGFTEVARRRPKRPVMRLAL